MGDAQTSRHGEFKRLTALGTATEQMRVTAVSAGSGRTAASRQSQCRADPWRPRRALGPCLKARAGQPFARGERAKARE